MMQEWADYLDRLRRNVDFQHGETYRRAPEEDLDTKSG
jgi:hypothetical protein